MRHELSEQDFCRIEPKNGGRLEAIMHLVERGLEDHNRICVPVDFDIKVTCRLHNNRCTRQTYKIRARSLQRWLQVEFSCVSGVFRSFWQKNLKENFANLEY